MKQLISSLAHGKCIYNSPVFTLGKHCCQQCLAAILLGIKPSITEFVVQHANQLATGDHSEGTFQNIYLNCLLDFILLYSFIHKSPQLDLHNKFHPNSDKTLSLEFRAIIVHLTNASIKHKHTPLLISPGLSKGCWVDLYQPNFSWEQAFVHGNSLYKLTRSSTPMFSSHAVSVILTMKETVCLASPPCFQT